jgi:hypothetical protein
MWDNPASGGRKNKYPGLTLGLMPGILIKEGENY